jgi:environmental stress-induced protein Ves
MVSPASGAAGDFDWRISMAEVGVSGPFSSFPGIDRTLRVLEGHLELVFADAASVHILTPDTAALDFPGDVAARGQPLDGPVLDLNLMVRRGVFHGSIQRLPSGVVPIADGDVAALLLLALQHTTIRVGDGHFALDTFDALHLDRPRVAASLTVDQTVLVIRIDKVAE